MLLLLIATWQPRLSHCTYVSLSLCVWLSVCTLVCVYVCLWTRAQFSFACAHLFLLVVVAVGICLQHSIKRGPPQRRRRQRPLGLSGDIYNKFICLYFSYFVEGVGEGAGRYTCCQQSYILGRQHVASAECCTARLPLLAIHIHNHIRSCKLTFCVNERRFSPCALSTRLRVVVFSCFVPSALSKAIQ